MIVSRKLRVSGKFRVKPDPVSGTDLRARQYVMVSWSMGLLVLLMVAYALFFSAYSLQRHASFNTHAADLSYFDQPMWNTTQGHFMERTLGDRQAPRMTDHMEPILVPISLVFCLWDDVRAILIVQSLALALGALPVYLIARAAFARRRREDDDRLPAAGDAGAEGLALAFAAAYLLFPALEAANLADFHADPLIVAPLLFAFYYAAQRRYRPMWIWAGIAVLVKENLPTMTFMLGLYLACDGILPELRRGGLFRDRAAGPAGARWPRFRHRWLTERRLHGLALMAVSLIWLYIAMFVIVGSVAKSFYGAEGPIYLSTRYTGLGGGAPGMARGLLAMLGESARLGYLAGLFASVGWLALFAPEYLLLGTPVLFANLFSDFPGQYSGEQHYTAALAPVFLIAAIFGARRLRALAERVLGSVAPNRRALFGLVPALIGVWLLAFSLSHQIQSGWTPLGRNFDWPQVTAHQRLLARFAAQIPADAALSTTPPLHPHLAHRRVIYVFPIVKDADYVLVDVSGVTDMHPNDVQGMLARLTASDEFGVVDAADGYVLLARGRATGALAQALPDAFYDFARAPDARPEHPLDITFGGKVKLVGYDLLDDPKWRLTHFRFYWQPLKALPAEASISAQVLTQAGEVADDTALRPMPALLWYPPARWQVGETVVTETLPWYLPKAWAPVISVAAAGQLLEPAGAREVSQEDRGADPFTDAACLPDGRLRLAQVRRAGWDLTALPAWPGTVAAPARFRGPDWQVELGGFAAPAATYPGASLPVALLWQGWQAAAPTPAPRDYTVFVHLRAAAGQTVANGDASPTWFAPWPTSQWRPYDDRPLVAVPDAHALTLPADLAPGRYDLIVGWYYWETGERLALVDDQGNVLGDELVLGQVTVDPDVAPQPDISCLFASACCASGE